MAIGAVAVLFQPRILKDRRERRTTAVRQRIHPGLTIVHDESPDGHGLHRFRDNSHRSMVDPGRGAEQDSVLCVELRCAATCSTMLSPVSFMSSDPKGEVRLGLHGQVHEPTFRRGERLPAI